MKFDGCLVDDMMIGGNFRKWTCAFLSAVARFGIALSADLSVCLDGFRICLLWLLIICLVLFMQL